MTISQIEISPSDRAKCKRCSKKIGIGTPRGVATTKQSYGYSNYYYCYKCAELEIKDGIERLKDTDRDLKKLIKEKQKAIVLMELQDGNDK